MDSAIQNIKNILKNELYEEMKEEHQKKINETKDKCEELKSDCEKVCNEEINKCETKCDLALKRHNESCNKKIGKLKKIISKCENLLASLGKTSNFENDEIINLIFFDKKEFLVRKSDLINGSDFFRAFFSTNFKRVEIENKIFINRSGILFNYIINFLQDNYISINEEENEILTKLMIDADYYNMPNLMAAIYKIKLKKFFLREQKFLLMRNIVLNLKDVEFYGSYGTYSNSRFYKGMVTSVDKNGFISFTFDDGDYKKYSSDSYEKIFYKKENKKVYFNTIFDDIKINVFSIKQIIWNGSWNDCEVSFELNNKTYYLKNFKFVNN